MNTNSLGYRDLNPDPDNSHGDLIRDEAAIIIGSLRNLLRCPKGDRSRIFRPKYHTLLYEFLQEPIDDQTATAMRMSLIQSIDEWEPRIELVKGQCGVIPDLTIPGYHIVIAFRYLERSDIQKASFKVAFGQGIR